MVSNFVFCVSGISAIPAAALHFSPAKLVFLVLWFYGCLFFAQRSHFSTLVRRERRTLVSSMSLFIGPVLFLILFLVDAVTQGSEEQGSILDTIKEKLRGAGSAIVSPGDDLELVLLDSSGRNIKEIFGHGKRKRQDNKILKLTSKLISNAINGRASDILIDPKSSSLYTVRYRIDGVLRLIDEIDSGTCHAVVNSIKAVSEMDIAEKRRPQDGSFLAQTDEGMVSFRAASAGVRGGEKLTIRVLNQNADSFTLVNIGLTEKQRAIIEDTVLKPSGMILICGPTGSGKTTTMYGMLNRIDLSTRNVITVEDPIEYVLENASQIEVNPKAGITFAKSLRSILRQDPDVICVGEIRDEETAGIALRASQTGHLVMATVHCNSNSAAIIRLLDLGVTPVLMASGLSLLLSQRLLRRLCPRCKKPASLSKGQIHNFHKRGINCKKISQPVGCDYCNGTGYRGRIAIFDFLPITDKLRTNIANNEVLITELRKKGDQKGKSNLQKQGLKAVVSGVSSFEELKRVVG